MLSYKRTAGKLRGVDLTIAIAVGPINLNRDLQPGDELLPRAGLDFPHSQHLNSKYLIRLAIHTHSHTPPSLDLKPSRRRRSHKYLTRHKEVFPKLKPISVIRLFPEPRQS